MRPAEFNAIAAASAQVAVLWGTQRLGTDPGKALLQWVEDGGSLILFLSTPSDSANLAMLQELSEAELILPFSTGPMISSSSVRPALHLAQANFEHPILKKFRDVADLGNVSVTRAFRTQRNQDQGEVLLKYDDGTVAMARKSHGQGSLLVCNLSPEPSCSDLAKRTIFVPLLHEMVKGMRPQSGAVRSFAVGQNASATVSIPDGVDEWRFEDPQGQPINAGYETRQNEAAFFFGRTTVPGFYRIFSGDRHLGSAAVNVDSRESNLEALGTGQIQEFAQLSRERFHAVSGMDTDALGRLLEGLPLWPYCMLLALVFIALEQLLVLVWRR